MSEDPKSIDKNLIRINKLLAEKGVASRRGVDTLIEQKRVKVNGITIEGPGLKIDPTKDVIEVDGNLIEISVPVEHSYLILNKPIGYLCSRKSQGGDPTVFELPSLRGFDANLKYAGRLDRDTSGLLILTTDGDFANQVTHPSFELPKKYHAGIFTPLNQEAVSTLKSGFDLLEDGELRFLKVRPLGKDQRGLHSYDVVVTEGRNRLVRRIFEAVGYTVEKLERYAIGALSLDGIEPGEFRPISPKELSDLKVAPAQP